MVRNLFTLITSAPLVVLLLFVLIWYLGVIVVRKVYMIRFVLVRKT